MLDIGASLCLCEGQRRRSIVAVISGGQFCSDRSLLVVAPGGNAERGVIVTGVARQT